MKIRNLDGELVSADHVRHLRTLTAGNSLGGSNVDLDEYRLADGSMIVASSPDDARAVPQQVGEDYSTHGR